MLPKQSSGTEISTGYQALPSSVSELLQRGRQNAAKSVNAVLTTTYWLVGRRLVEYEQGGKERAAYGAELLKRLSGDLQTQFGRGFSERNLEQMRQFYLQWENPQTLSADSGAGTPQSGLRRSPRVCNALKNLEAERCHGRVHHRPDRIADKERSSYSQFPNPHWESWSGEELATSAVGAPTSRCGSGGAIPNPRRKPIFGVVGLMYKRWRTLQMVR
jgi:hypothetical protein